MIADERLCGWCRHAKAPGEGGFMIAFGGGPMMYCDRFATWQKAWQPQEGCETIWEAWDAE